jgi:hypothetical protein
MDTYTSQLSALDNDWYKHLEFLWNNYQKVPLSDQRTMFCVEDMKPLRPISSEFDDFFSPKGYLRVRTEFPLETVPKFGWRIVERIGRAVYIIALDANQLAWRGNTNTVLEQQRRFPPGFGNQTADWLVRCDESRSGPTLEAEDRYLRCVYERIREHRTKNDDTGVSFRDYRDITLRVERLETDESFLRAWWSLLHLLLRDTDNAHAQLLRNDVHDPIRSDFRRVEQNFWQAIRPWAPSWWRGPGLLWFRWRDSWISIGDDHLKDMFSKDMTWAMPRFANYPSTAPHLYPAGAGGWGPSLGKPGAATLTNGRQLTARQHKALLGQAMEYVPYNPTHRGPKYHR